MSKHKLNRWKKLLFGGIAMISFISSLIGTATSQGGYIEEDAWVPMRDGVKLYTKIWRPDNGSYPVVLTRGYSPGNSGDAKKFNRAGYIYVGQSCRGHGSSEGSHGIDNRFFDDAKDGYDMLDWLSQQAWCDGNITMYGKSFWGATQWLVAPEQHPNLKAIIPQVINADFWQYGYRANGAVTLAMTAHGRAFTDPNDPKKYGWMEFYRYLPLIDMDKEVSGVENKLWNDYITHSSFDSFWQEISIRGDGGDGKYHKITIPVYMMGGWYDYYAGAAFTSFQRLREVGATNEIRIVINPSDHLNRIVGDRDFPGGEKDEIALAIRWLDYVIKGIDNGIKDEPPIKIYVMGLNQWRGEHEWPLARTAFTKYYFHSNGTKDGWLSTEPPGDEPSTTYIYDPDDPVPNLGGNHSYCWNDVPEDIMCVGTVDQRPIESRQDVLVFTSPPVEDDTEVTGPIVIKLYAASSAKDTDFTSKLIDVYPDGKAYNLTEGIIRARFRESIWDPPKPLVPGVIYEYTLELQPTSNVFLKGHSIRVHLSSSNFPLWDRNPNTGHDIGMDTELQVAEQTIYHDRDHPSHIILPVIPKRN